MAAVSTANIRMTTMIVGVSQNFWDCGVTVAGRLGGAGVSLGEVCSGAREGPIGTISYSQFVDLCKCNGTVRNVFRSLGDHLPDLAFQPDSCGRVYLGMSQPCPDHPTPNRYKSLGVRPVFLARTFTAVGPRVTLSW